MTQKQKSLTAAINNIYHNGIIKLNNNKSSDKNLIHESVQKTLSGQALVDNLTSIAMSGWYEVMKKFSAQPDLYDIYPPQKHDKFNVLKMSPGDDVKDAAFEFLTKSTSSLAAQLNKAFSKNVFDAQITRSGDSLNSLVAFRNAKGGVFQVKASSNGADTSIFVTMPNEGELNKAFSAMADVPHPGEDLDDGLDDNVDTTDNITSDDPVPEVPNEDGDMVVSDDDLDINLDADGDNLDTDLEDDDAKKMRMRHRHNESFSEANEIFKVAYTDERGVKQVQTFDNKNAAESAARRMQTRYKNISVETMAEEMTAGADQAAGQSATLAPDAGPVLKKMRRNNNEDFKYGFTGGMFRPLSQYII